MIDSNANLITYYDKKKLVKQKNISKIIEKSNDINSMILVKYKIYIDDYIKKSKYPNISKWITI